MMLEEQKSKQPKPLLSIIQEKSSSFSSSYSQPSNNTSPGTNNLSSSSPQLFPIKNSTNDSDITICSDVNVIPLSWKEARVRLRSILEKYMDESLLTLTQRHEQEKDDSTFITNNHSNISTTVYSIENIIKKLPSKWFQKHMDIYFISIPFNIIFLILSIVSHEKRKRQDIQNAIFTDNTKMRFEPMADLSVYKSFIAASTLLLVGTLISVWIIHRRAYTSTRDYDAKKRNIVASFIQSLDTLHHEEEEEEIHNDCDSPRRIINPSPPLECKKLPGTPLTDIYPVYRLTSPSNAQQQTGEWHQIPSLLLVKGDFISLQIGDIVPANCKLVPLLQHTGKTKDNSMLSKSLNSLPPLHEQQPQQQQDSYIFHAGDKVQESTLIQKMETNGQCHPSFPAGGSTLHLSSKGLLQLCSSKRVYIVEEAPLETFLYEKRVCHKPPQIHRQIGYIRSILFLFSVCAFLFTLILIFIRPGVELSLLLYLPFLAALAVLPICTPTILFLLEIIGTSRILCTVHLYATRNGVSSSFSSSSTYVSSEQYKFLCWRYFFHGILSRLSIDTLRWKYRHRRRYHRRNEEETNDSLVDFPPISSCMFERLGVVTALTLVDDELACDPNSIPQQLLIPSSHGLKLLDIFPKVDDEDDNDESESDERRNTHSNASSSDSDSDVEEYASKRRINILTKRYRRRNRRPPKRSLTWQQIEDEETEMQFEDVNWWHYLPALKSIGLACLLVDDNDNAEKATSSRSSLIDSFTVNSKLSSFHYNKAEHDLIRHISQFHRRRHLLSLAHCIGFDTKPNTFGIRGDITPFTETRRLHVIRTRLLRDRMMLDRHAIGLEESRTWGLLRPDCTAVLVHDDRSKAYQLLTVGDARVVTEFCTDAWQGEISTITPLSPADRKIILEHSKTWSLADLDVTAFSYAPIPYTLEQKFGSNTKQKSSPPTRTYLIDNRPSDDIAITIRAKDSGADDWSLMKNQIFLGLLGSSISPRREIGQVLEICGKAGIRFVYFSPRNMRRTKELASQMGMEMSWNCAISLRPLHEGEIADIHRMTSHYADWDVNARLPHGVENVKKHLQEVDNVPLLVSLYTDATKETTKEMVEVFQNYHDTVLALGLSHISHNNRIFSRADLSIGFDILVEQPSCDKNNETSSLVPKSPQQKQSSSDRDNLSYVETSFVSSISTQSALFSLALARGGLHHLSEIIERGRVTLESVITAGFFMVTSYLSFSLLVMMTPCSVSTVMPYVPGVGSLLYLHLIVPLLILALVFTTMDNIMTLVPQKNDESVTFSLGERRRIFLHTLLRAMPPAIFSQIIYLIAVGSLLLEFEEDLLQEMCSMSTKDIEKASWVSVIRCDALKSYSGPAKISSGCLMLSEFCLCIVALSASFIYRFKYLTTVNVLVVNPVWVMITVVCVIIVIGYLTIVLDRGSLGSLPWYFYLLAFVQPLICLMISEALKKNDIRLENRAQMLRRLQFETRLGMWSPK